MIPFPNKKYDIIYADPPWQYASKIYRGNADEHYEVMSVEDICNLPVKDIANKDCILFLWITYPKIREALSVVEGWGFEYKTIGVQWIEQNKSGDGYFFGLGRWTRGNSEACIIATRGTIHRENAGISQLIVPPIQEHSRKPAIVRDKIVELVGDRPRIELFSRETSPGWDVWGNETTKFDGGVV